MLYSYCSSHASYATTWKSVNWRKPLKSHDLRRFSKNKIIAVQAPLIVSQAAVPEMVSAKWMAAHRDCPTNNLWYGVVPLVIPCEWQKSCHIEAFLELYMYVCMLSHFSHVRLFATLWTVARQAPLSMGFSRQEYWSGWPCPSPGDLPSPGIELASLRSPALAGRFFPSGTTW